METTTNPDIEWLPTREGYDRWSVLYDAEFNPLVQLEDPLLRRLLGDVAGLVIADIGCGTGRHALPMAAAGARVTAVDFSEGMLAKARQKPGADAVRFVQHDLSQPLPLDSAAFDRVLCALVLDHIERLADFLGELKRICRPDGFIVASAIHPLMLLRGVRARFTDPGSGRETRPHSYAHQIADYVMAATQADLWIDHMSEHAVDEELGRRDPRAAKYVGWPTLLLMKLRSR